MRCSPTARIAAYVVLLAVSASFPASAETPPLPSAADDSGRLPRSYAGWQLGEPAPEGDPKQGHALFRDTEVFIERLSDEPRIFRKALVHDGEIFRIEWVIRDPSLDRDRVIAAFSERLGSPMDSPYAVRDGAEWSDGTGRGRTTVMVRRANGSDWLTVAVQDAGMAVDLWSP